MSYDPAIKMLLRYKKDLLVVKAKELNLNFVGTKLELAVRIAKFQEEEQIKLWRSISGKECKFKKSIIDLS